MAMAMAMAMVTDMATMMLTAERKSGICNSFA